MQLTVTVITLNEARDIAGALESVEWADEVLVVDSGSTDGTVDLAQAKGARVIERQWPGYGAQRNFAADAASHNWILSVDADERVTPELAAEIRELMARGPDALGYRVSRVSRYLGRWIRTTDWFPDYQLRLYDRRAGRWNGLRVHESFQLSDGQPAQLRGELQHHAYRDISDHLKKIDAYTTLTAEQSHQQGRRTHAVAIAAHPLAAFIRNFILRGGFRDGTTGLIISVLNSYYVFLKLAKLWERQHKSGGRGSGHR